MAYEEGDIKVFNPSKEISKEIILEILIRHRDSLKQARTGYMFDIDNKIKEKEKILNKVRGLNLVISAQREMITLSRPVIFFRSMTKWKNKYKEEEKRINNKFEEEENDYNIMINKWLGFLKSCEMEIINAERTKTISDDFVIKRDTDEGEKYYLSKNFYELLDDLEFSYEQIYLLMLTNKIVSAGISEDEELTYKEKEAEAVKRIIEA